MTIADLNKLGIYEIKENEKQECDICGQIKFLNADEDLLVCDDCFDFRNSINTENSYPRPKSSPKRIKKEVNSNA